MGLFEKKSKLEKARDRLEKVSKRHKQLQFNFVREQNSRGRFRTTVYVEHGEKTYHGNNKGLLHKAVNARFRIKGDRPSFTRAINGFEMQTKGGKFVQRSAKVTNFLVHDVGQTAVDVGLASETLGLKTAETAGREALYHYKNKYMREAADDYHKGIFFMGEIAVDSIKGTRSHFKQKRQSKLEKAKYKLRKEELKDFKKNGFKPKSKKNKADFKKKKADFKARKKSYKESKKKGSKSKIGKAMFKKRKQEFRHAKKEFRNAQKQLRSEKTFKVKEKKNQGKIARFSRTSPLVLKPVGYSAKRVKNAAWQKAVSEDSDNDMLHAIDSTNRRVVQPTKQQFSVQKKLDRKQTKRDKLSDQNSKSKNKLNRQERKLKEKGNSMRKHKKKPPKPKKSAADKLKDGLKEIFNFIKNVYVKEVGRFFGSVAAPIILILLILLFIISIFTGGVSGGGFTLGTYAAQDYDLSEAEKYYTQLAYDFNEKVLKVGDSSNWKKGLKDLGADTSGMKDKPDEWIWGQSTVFDYAPAYDFDCYKLWSFLCAYYYDFDSDNGDIKYWSFKSGTKTLLEELFSDEYEFVYWYDNQSRWEELSSYVYFGGGNSTNGSYYYCESTASRGGGAWRYCFKPTSYTSELGQYLDGDGYCYINSGYRVLNPNDNYELTGYYILDNRYFADGGHTVDPFYWVDENGKFFFRNHEGNSQYRSFYGWDDGADDSWFMITEPDARAWTGDNNCSALFGYVQKQEWKTDCRLYYNVHQKKTFDEAIIDKLNSMSHADERVEYYNLLAGNDTATLYGNHQTLKNMTSEATLRDRTLTRQFGYEMNAWNESSDGLYEGVKISCTIGESLYAPFDCKITDVDTSNHKITLRKDDVEYWYDGTGGTKRDTEVYITNADLIDGLSEGDTIKTGDLFAVTTKTNVNFRVKIDTDGIGWDFIDPRLVFY